MLAIGRLLTRRLTVIDIDQDLRRNVCGPTFHRKFQATNDCVSLYSRLSYRK